MTPPFTHMGKQVLANGSHYADAADTRAAAFLADALNAHACRWQPIETAPRDGTQFLALASNGWYALAAAPAQELRENWPFQWWRSDSRQMFPVVETHPLDTDWAATYTLLLTHWMPLPTAPTTTTPVEAA